MALTISEIEKVRYHLRYPSVTAGASIGLGYPTYVQVLFPVEGALRNLFPEAEATVRLLIARCDSLDAELFTANRRLKASRVGSIELRENECSARRSEYDQWCVRLANACGVQMNPMALTGGTGINAGRIAA